MLKSYYSLSFLFIEIACAYYYNFLEELLCFLNFFFPVDSHRDFYIEIYVLEVYWFLLYFSSSFSEEL